MNNGYMQAEGVTDLDQVPATGALVAIGFPRLKGGTGGFASFAAICPADWAHGVRPGDVAEAPCHTVNSVCQEQDERYAGTYGGLRQAERKAELQLTAGQPAH